jgi:hypothetical protein
MLPCFIQSGAAAPDVLNTHDYIMVPAADCENEAAMHVLVMLIHEKTSLQVAGNMAIRVALELIQQRGYQIIRPSRTAQRPASHEKRRLQAFSSCGSPGSKSFGKNAAAAPVLEALRKLVPLWSPKCCSSKRQWFWS